MIAPAIMDIIEAISKARSGVSSPVFTLEDVELSFLFVDEVLSFVSCRRNRLICFFF